MRDDSKVQEKTNVNKPSCSLTGIDTLHVLHQLVLKIYSILNISVGIKMTLNMSVNYDLVNAPLTIS